MVSVGRVMGALAFAWAAASGLGVAAPGGGVYAKLDALPDWSGVWTLERQSAPAEKPALKGEYLRAYQAWKDEVRRNDGVVKSSASHCLPPGMPGMMSVGQYPIEFLFTPGRVTVNYEAWMQTRRIWTDGRAHPADPDPTFMGDSVGRWDGETLVADTVAITQAAPLAPGMNHSDKLRLIERIRLNPQDRDQLIDQITIEDPEALERPYELRLTYRRDRRGRLLEFECAENDRNPVDANGDTTFR